MLGQLIANGRTSDVHRFGDDGAAKVLQPTTPQHWAQAEASFTDAVRRLGVPAPEVRDLIDVDGRATIVFERIDGPSMWQRMIDHPDDVAALARELAAIQQAIHEAGVPDGLPSLVDRLRLKFGSVAEFDADELDEALALLDRQPIGAALLHGDLHPGNVLLGRDGPVVIDWFDATVGHPVADAARTTLLLTDGATDLRHLPGARPAVIAELSEQYAAASRTRVRPDALRTWCRLRAAGRLAERADLDVSGLLAMWRDAPSTSVLDDG